MVASYIHQTITLTKYSRGNKMQFSIDEYSKQYKMSKEMISSKLKSKKLDYIIEDGMTYIVTKDEPIAPKVEPIKEQKEPEPQGKKIIKTAPKPKTTVGAVISLYQRENTTLKEKIMQLESKIDKLIDDKEQMLRDERDKIEQLYTKKDEQLKNILELVNTKMLLQHQEQTIHDVQPVETTKAPLSIIELKDYLKTLDLKSYQRKVIKRRFLSVYDTDDRVFQKDGKLYLDFSKYDYSDLLSC